MFRIGFLLSVSGGVALTGAVVRMNAQLQRLAMPAPPGTMPPKPAEVVAVFQRAVHVGITGSVLLAVGLLLIVVWKRKTATDPVAPSE